MKGITSIGHVAIRVKEFERSLAFYVGKAGFSEMFRLDRDGHLWIIYLPVTDEQYLTATGPSSSSFPRLSFAPGESALLPEASGQAPVR